jgi:hypothetical protein
VAFSGVSIVLAGLIEIALPGGTVRLTDGGFVDWDGDMFTAEDAVFGAIESVEPVSEGISDEAPAGRLTLLPPKLAAASDLFRTDAQGSPIRFWMAEVDRATGLLVGDPELMFDGLIDSMSVRSGKDGRQVDIEFMAAAEKLFMIREGNVLSTRFHQLAWPGEKGFDHCTGVQGGVPWGTPDPARGSSGYSRSGSSGNGAAGV